PSKEYYSNERVASIHEITEEARSYRSISSMKSSRFAISSLSTTS
ncbi:1350_t:CDS:2, partial [Funneliformis geosporum]